MPPRLRVPLAFILLPVLALLPRTGIAELGPPHALVTLHDSGTAPIEADVRAVTRTADGTLLVGSNRLAAFDGQRWQAIEVPSAYGFRALAAASPRFPNRVWVGAIGAIGFVEKDANGTWRYTSLLPQLAAAGFPVVGDVWAVHPLDTGAVWVANEHALRWTAQSGGRFEIWHMQSESRLSAFGGGDAVWIHQEGVGLLRLNPSGPPVLTLPEASLPAGPVTWMIFADDRATPRLVGLNDAAYRWSEATGFQRLPELSQALQTTLPTAAVALDDNRIAIATFDDGLFLATRDGQPLAHYTTDEGLSDNTLYALLAGQGRLWAASPLGLSRLDGAGHASFFDRLSSLDGGRPIRVATHADRTFVLTTRDLFEMPAPATGSPPRLHRHFRAPGVFSDMLPSSDGLWIAGFGGIWRFSDNSVRQEYFASNDILRLCATQHVPRGILFLDGYRLKLLLPSTRGEWVTRDLAAAVSDSPVSLHEDPAGAVWVSTMTHGVVRFQWSSSAPPSSPRLEIDRVYRGGFGFPQPPGRTELVPFGHRLFAFTESGIFSLSSDQLRFEPTPDFSSFIGIAATRGSDEAPHLAYWLVQSRTLSQSGVFAVLRVELRSDGSLDVTPIDAPGLDSLGQPIAIAQDVGALWIGSNRGWLRLDVPSLVSPAAPPPPPLRATPSAPGGASLVFDFPLTAASGGSFFYETRLDGADAPWSTPAQESSRAFENLAPGHYRFEVRAFDRFGRRSPATVHAFTVLAPWWKSAPAIAFYALLLAATVAAAARWQVIRLRRQNEQLNRLVAQRTREIELASTAKSEFLDNVSHEIRNPLNGLTGLLALLDEERLDARERELTRSLKSIASTLTQVFEDVLQFSKLEYGYGRLARCPFALRPLLDDVLALFSAQARQAGCPLHVNWPADLVDGFEGDPEKIKTIIVNFVANALKYAPGSPVEIRVEATGETDGLVDLYLDVVDHGPGVPPDEQELIFKKFVRGKRARDSQVPGTGLGLATCSMLAKLVNGSVGVESTPGRGSTFFLKLLLPRAPLAAPNPALPSTRDPLAGPVLIVDDEPYNRAVLEGIARELGCDADSAATAEEALQRLAQRDYTLVFLDWELPDGNGGDIARALRARANGSHPAILATTAHDSDEMRQRCRDAGMDGFLLKPYNLAIVRRSIALARTSSAHHHTSLVAEPPVNGTTAGLDFSAFEFFGRAQSADTPSAREHYIEALDEHARILAAAVAAGETETISREAHRLRALSGLVHAIELNRAAARLEQLARDRATTDCPAAWTETHRACEELKSRLRA